MNIDKILNNPLINRAELARLMYPHKIHKPNDPTPNRYLYSKMHNIQRQSLTPADKEKIKKIIADLFAEIYN